MGHVFGNTEVFVEAGVLKDNADSPADPIAVLDDIVAQNPCDARGGGDERGEYLE